jgi:hypothetical protein
VKPASGLTENELRRLVDQTEYAAALSAKTRNALPDSAFVFPDERAYPIHDIEHARKALQLGAKHESGDRLAKIRAAVYRRYPQLKPDSGD